MATDPVCGMQVDTESAPAMLAHGTHSHFFCSDRCKSTFLADPARYGDAHLAAEGGERIEMERHEPPHTTTGFLTAPKFGAAGSGGLEYEPIPEQHDHRDEERDRDRDRG